MVLAYFTSPDRAKAVRQFVQTLCTFYFEKVTPRELDVLCAIVFVGKVDYDAKNMFMLNHQASEDVYNQNLDRLKKKGILLKKEFRTGKELHPHFMNHKNLIESDEKEKLLVLKFAING